MSKIPATLHPDLAQLIREEIRAGFFCDPPVTTRDQPHDIELQRRVLASLMAGFRPLPFVLIEDDLYGVFHREIYLVIEGAVQRAGHLDAEWETIEDCPVMVGAPLQKAAGRLRALRHQRNASEHLRRAIARIETGDAPELIEESICVALNESRDAASYLGVKL